MIVGIASIYHDLDIYFPIRIDTRNYPLPDYFNYPSTEVAKSLLQFKIPGMITI
jgi:DNA-directed RNA polymerase